MNVIHLPGITVALDAIHAGGAPRRQRERDAVAGILRRLLGREAEVRHRPDGSPYLEGGPHISISHSRHAAAVALSDESGIGIDVEEDRTAQLAAVAPRVLTPAELAVYAPSRLLEAWTIKEAAFKAASLPLADLRAIDITVPGMVAVDEVEMEIIFSGPVDSPCKLWVTVVKKLKKNF